MEVAGLPIGLFPAIDSSDPEWNFRTAHYSHMLGDLAEETLRSTIRFMNAQHHYHLILRRGISQLTSTAQGHCRHAERQVAQVEVLQAMVTEKEEIIAERNETIAHREDQINESDATITQHNTVIEFLQEKIHDLILEVDDTFAQINELQQ
jgi:chromosome segregation ATPase